MPTTTEIHTDVTWTPEAWDQYQVMRARAAKIGDHWGPALGDRAIASLGLCIMHVLASGPTTVYKDGNGLLFQTPYIVMGMVFHSDSAEKMAKRLGMHHTADEIEACFGYAPPSGEWSLHS